VSSRRELQVRPRQRPSRAGGICGRVRYRSHALGGACCDARSADGRPTPQATAVNRNRRGMAPAAPDSLLGSRGHERHALSWNSADALRTMQAFHHTCNHSPTLDRDASAPGGARPHVPTAGPWLSVDSSNTG
jgi:hypothetical protein